MRTDRLTAVALLRWLPASSVRLLHTACAASCPTGPPIGSAAARTVAATSTARQRRAAAFHRPLSTLSPAVRSDGDIAPSTSHGAPSEADTSSSAASLQPWPDTMSLHELRSMLSAVIPNTATLLSLIQHVRSAPHVLGQLSPSDYALLCHHLSLHNAAYPDYRALTCVVLMDVYDEYCARERLGAAEDDSGWGRGWRRELMADTLNVCSRTGEGKGCELVVMSMSLYGLPLTARDMNLVLWGLRHDQGRQWLWYELMARLSRAMATGEEPSGERASRTVALFRALQAGDELARTRDSGLFRPDSVTLLILMHSAALSVRPHEERFTRLDSVLRRLTASGPFYLPAAAPTTVLLLNQLISLSSILDRDSPHRFSHRVHALFRLAAELRCPLTERSLRLAVGAAHILQHRQDSRASSHDTAEQQPNDGARADHSHSSVDGAQFAKDVLAAFQHSGVRVGHSSALLFDLQTASSAPWQRVLELFEWVQHEGGHINMQRALTAIEACYRGKHWQRALDILVLPKWAKGFIHTDTRDSSSRSSRERQSASSRAEQRTATGGEHISGTPHALHQGESLGPIEWQATDGRWNGPQHDRLVWVTELKGEPWLLLTPIADLPATSAAVPSLPVSESLPPALDRAPLPVAPLSYPVTVLHFAYTIAAMDEAGNAEALLKADRLHQIALRLLPFLGYLYQYDTNTIHLHHPLIALDTVSQFVREPRNQRAKLFSLLYLVFRTMRRHFVENSTDVPLLRHAALFGSRLHDRWGTSKRAAGLRRDLLRFRVASEEEARTLQRLLTQPPFELRRSEEAGSESDPSGVGVVKRCKLYELAGYPVRQHEKQPIERTWWQALHGGQRMSQEVVVLELPSWMWNRSLQSTLEDE